jgi:hypothetical protein
MASANWEQAGQLQARLPHTYTAMEHLIMAMADAFNNRGKTTFFGNDKGLKSYLKFEDKLKNALLAMTLDGFVVRTDSSKKYLEALLLVLDAWQQIFPNWPDAEAFAYEKFRANEIDAKKLISSLIGVS